MDCGGCNLPNQKISKWIRVSALFALSVCILAALELGGRRAAVPVQTKPESGQGKGSFIKYVEFNVPYLALKKALNIDIESHKSGKNRSWITILAYLGAKYGGNFDRYKSADMDAFVNQQKTRSIEEITKNMKYYPYYSKAYSAVLGGLVGTYKAGGVEQYGLIAFSPIAKGFPYTDCDDFGVRRIYGYSRPHLGHDMMAATGTPVIAVESGVVEALGWNQYGGWRIGIRSFDSRRYYYYAHLRQNRPYVAGLSVGQTVKAGDVIGYVGRTGYSSRENVNNIKVSHLHFGLQLIFDESQKECVNEIWVDPYALTQLLRQNRSAVSRDDATREYHRVQDMEIE